MYSAWKLNKQGDNIQPWWMLNCWIRGQKSKLSYRHAEVEAVKAKTLRMFRPAHCSFYLLCSQEREREKPVALFSLFTPTAPLGESVLLWSVTTGHLVQSIEELECCEAADLQPGWPGPSQSMSMKCIHVSVKQHTERALLKFVCAVCFHADWLENRRLHPGASNQHAWFVAWGPISNATVHTAELCSENLAPSHFNHVISLLL